MKKITLSFVLVLILGGCVKQTISKEYELAELENKNQSNTEFIEFALKTLSENDTCGKLGYKEKIGWFIVGNNDFFLGRTKNEIVDLLGPHDGEVTASEHLYNFNKDTLRNGSKLYYFHIVYPQICKLENAQFYSELYFNQNDTLVLISGGYK